MPLRSITKGDIFPHEVIDVAENTARQQGLTVVRQNQARRLACRIEIIAAVGSLLVLTSKDRASLVEGDARREFADVEHLAHSDPRLDLVKVHCFRRHVSVDVSLENAIDLRRSDPLNKRRHLGALTRAYARRCAEAGR